MLENLYTTKMSANKKILQNRFAKIRSKNGRLSKIMALVMSVAIAVTMLCATVVMAAVGSDGLEYWDKNEAYMRESIRISVNVDGKRVPSWVDEIKNTDGTINITVNRIQVRNTSGWVEYYYIASLNNKTKLINTSRGTGDRSERIGSYPATDIFEFNDFNPGYDDSVMDIQKVLGAEFTDKQRGISIQFGTDETNYSKPVVAFYNYTREEQASGVKHVEYIDADTTEEIGAFLKTYQYLNYIRTYRQELFTDYEEHYSNRSVDNISISVTAADTNGITLNIKSPSDRVKSYCIYGFNRYGGEILRYGYYGQSTEAHGNDIITLAPFNENKRQENQATYYTKVTDEERNGKFTIGDTYRIDIGLIDENNNVVYRHQEYVTIK